MKARYLQGKVGIWVSRESRPTVSTVSRKQSACARSGSTTNAPLQTQAAWGRGHGEGRDRCPEARVLRVPAPEGRGLPTELGQRRRPRRHQSALCGSCHCPLPLLLPVLPKIRVPLCAREIGAQGDRTVFIYWKWWEPGGGGCMPSVSLFEKLFVLYWGERK